MEWVGRRSSGPFLLVYPKFEQPSTIRSVSALRTAMPFQPQDLLQIAPHQASTCLEGTTVLLDTRRGHYYSLPEVASVIWSLLEQPTTLAALLEMLQARYVVDLQVCRSDTEEFLEQLRQRGLLRVTSR